MTNATAEVLQCKHCPARTAILTEDVARNLGWRMYSGPTIGGGWLDDVVCPACAGKVDRPADGWRVACSTCDWVYEDDFDEGPLTAKQAKEMAASHECEPVVEIAPPSGNEWYLPSDVDDAGNVNKRGRGR